jgi:Ca2+-binding protein (EF-Hand superfamily)
LKIQNITIALALTVAAAVPMAQAQTADEAKQLAAVDKWFEQYDRNHDAQLTVDEFSLGKSYFHALDLDKNGILTREEAKAASIRKSTNTTNVNWMAMDADNDGYVTVREWKGTPEDFDTLDLDHDRVLSRYDRDLAREHNRAKGRLAAYDKDKDGLVSIKEWPADEATFRQRDHNRDGMLNVDELAEDVKRKE